MALLKTVVGSEPLIPGTNPSVGANTSQARETESIGFTTYGYDAGLPRTVGSPLRHHTSEQLRDLATDDPLRLQNMLLDIHVSAEYAMNIMSRLTSPTSSNLQFIAHKIGNSNMFTEPNDEATSEVAAFFAKQPPEVGGMVGIYNQLLIEFATKGMGVVECVPDKRKLKGLSRVYVVDSSTIELFRPDRNEDLMLRQYQYYPFLSPADKRRLKKGNNPIPSFSGWNKVTLSPDFTFWSALDSTTRNVYGRALLNAAATECIADLALIADLRDAVHNNAFPSMQVGVNLVQLHKVAVEVLHITDPSKASKWAMDRFYEIAAYIETKGAGDNVVCDSNGDFKNIGGGNFQGMEGVLAFLRQRVVQSLKTLPTLLGINDGANYNYTSVEWNIYAQTLEDVRAFVIELLCKIADTHLRYLGIAAKVKALYTKIRTNDALIEANAESIRIDNATKRMQLGFTSAEEESTQLVGHEPVSKPLIDLSNAKSNSVSGNIPNNPNSEGKSQDEKNSQNNKNGSSNGKKVLEITEAFL